MGKIEIIKGDITKVEADAIVNAANERLMHGGGVALAIAKAAGEKLIEESRKIGYCPKAGAVYTTAGNLKAKYVIHTVGPIYGVDDKPEELLAKAYKSSLELAKKLGCKTIAFPSISTGIYGFPIEKAAPIALDVLFQYKDDFEKIMMVLFTTNDYNVYKKYYDLKVNK